jgi:DNA-binding NarL/FixJ family response regulator
MSEKPQGGGTVWAQDAPRTLEAYSLGPGLEDFVVLTHRLQSSGLPDVLTKAEREVGQGIVDGLSNAEIARRRRVSMRTIANQVASLFRRLHVSSRADFVRRVLAEGKR